MEISPLPGVLGAEVWGLDLARALDESALAGVRAALAEHKVLAFRDRDLAPTQRIALTPHLAVNGYDGHRRLLHRATVVGERPACRTQLKPPAVPASPDRRRSGARRRRRSSPG